MAIRRLPPSQNDCVPRRAHGSRRFCTFLLVLGLALSGLWVVGPTARTAERDPQPSDGPARPFLARHCQGCHAGDKPKGKFRLETLTQDFNDKANRERWLAVSEQVKSG